MLLLALVATVVVYFPAFSGRLIWNDNDYVTAPALRSAEGLSRIWTQLGATEQYYPLLHSVFWLEHKIWGDAPFGYHVVTLAFHLIATALLAWLLRRLNVPGAWLAALLFALHPVHVESVVWITEQKNTLSLVFYLATALAYLRFEETRAPRHYVAVVVGFFLSLLCKTVTATLPAALLVIAWWRRGRLEGRRDFRPLLPLVLLGGVAGVFSSWVEQKYLGAKGADFALPLWERVLVAGRAIWFYAGKLVWPFQLNFIYPRWVPDAAVWWQWLFPLAALALGFGGWRWRRRTRTPLAVFLLFVGALFPVLGFVNLYGALFSWVWDHWQYLPDLAPLALLGAGLARAALWLEARVRFAGHALLALVFVLLGSLSWRHTRWFHDNLTLYQETLARNPNAWLAHYNLGVELGAIPGQELDAIAHYQATLRLQPDYTGARVNLANLLLKLPGREAEAAAQYEQALRDDPASAEAHFNLANLLTHQPERLKEAVSHYEAALRLKPNYSTAQLNLGATLLKMPGREAEALAILEAAVALRPEDPAAYFNLGLARLKSLRLAEAIQPLENAVRLAPEDAEARFYLGNALMQAPGRSTEAIAHYEAALRLRPDYARAHLNLGVALSSLGQRASEATGHFQAAVRLNPNDPEARYNLGIALLEAGQSREAAAQFQAALQSAPNFEPARQALESLRSAGR